MPRKAAYSWPLTYCCSCSCTAVCFTAALHRGHPRCGAWRHLLGMEQLRELLLPQLDKPMFLVLWSILQVRTGNILPMGSALLSPLLAAGHVGSSGGAPGAVVGPQPENELGLSSSACPWLLSSPVPWEVAVGWGGGETLVPPDWKSLPTSFGSPTPWVSAARPSDWGCQHQIV